jgi:rsbT antagonist protein RsbS
MDRLPILKLGDVLLVTLQGDLEDATISALEDDLTARIVKTGAHGALIDVSSLDVVDTFVGRALANIAAMARVLDAEVVVVGIRPAVAITLVELGVQFHGVRTALDVETGMALLRTSIDAGTGDVPSPN